MPDAITILLLGDPVPWAQNSNPNATGAAVHFRPIPKKQRNTFAALRGAAQLAMIESGMTKPFDCAVSLTLRAEFAVPKTWSKIKRNAAFAGSLPHTSRPDLSKVLRLAEDALISVVYSDDKLICRHILSKRYSAQPKIVITVEPI